MQVRQHFDVHRDHGGAGGRERLDVPIGIRDHQVNIERHGGHAPDRRNDRRPDGNVRHEVAVHDIDVNEIGAPAFGSRDGAPERGEIG